MKKTIKSTKPTIVVDLTNAESYKDVQFEFTRGKSKAGYPLTDQEIDQVVYYGASLALDAMNQFLKQGRVNIFTVDSRNVKKVIEAIEKVIKPKTPWYKKVWNWIKKPFVKK